MVLPVSSLVRDFVYVSEGAPIWRLDAGDLPSLGEAVIAVGAFDGFHRGHAELLSLAQNDARRRGLPVYAVTFDPDPDCVVGRGPAKRLTTTDDRLRLLAASGVNGVVVVPFTHELASLDHEAFFESVLGRLLTVRAVHVGIDFRLGAGGASTVEVMAHWGASRGVDVIGHDLVCCDGETISASRIRRDLAAGAVDVAARKLGRSYLVRGRVRTGRGQGTGMGFPTANIQVSDAMQLPADGVYAGYALVDDTVWPAAINVGLPPLFADDPRAARLEASLLGFSGDIYGHQASLVFIRRLRPLLKFDSIDKLIETVLRDIETVRESFGEEGVDLRDFG